MTTTSIKAAKRLKFDIFSEGIALSETARRVVADAQNKSTGTNGLSSSDYSSTSGIILAYYPADDTSHSVPIYVNAPTCDNNSNFVTRPATVLDFNTDHGLFLKRGDSLYDAEYVFQPRYHNVLPAGSDAGRHFGQKKSPPPLTSCVTHGDRVRLSPIRGCSMCCRFCSVPHQEQYHVLTPQECIRALKIAIADEVQPASHVMLSGGTPRKEDTGRLTEIYSAVLGAFPDIPVDIMMSPADGVFDFKALSDCGICQLSINLEIFDEDIARRMMPHKAAIGKQTYLEAIEDAVNILDQSAGRRCVRSILMVGIEPLSSTLQGVRAIAERGGVPVLSPFRPDPATPLSKHRPPGADMMWEAYEGAAEILAEFDIGLGPECLPCTHNTLSFAEDSVGRIGHSHKPPKRFSGRD